MTLWRNQILAEEAIALRTTVPFSIAVAVYRTNHLNVNPAQSPTQEHTSRTVFRSHHSRRFAKNGNKSKPSARSFGSDSSLSSNRTRCNRSGGALAVGVRGGRVPTATRQRR
mmetsp:Transcript_21105/g.41832  ORF Transcript_21105/g.41832 Transcript_21105/m.41832 type:complete len:112 (-) Transcript_21105:353-688(-)